MISALLTLARAVCAAIALYGLYLLCTAFPEVFNQWPRTDGRAASILSNVFDGFAFLYFGVLGASLLTPIR